MYHAYTNQIHFKPLKSSMGPKLLKSTAAELKNDVACSPKSMYRLADYVRPLIFALIPIESECT